MRVAARIDGNHHEIQDALERIGASVTSLASAGKGVPDLLVGFRGQNFLFEVKDPSQPPSGRRLTKWQRVFHRGWRGQVAVVLTPEDAFKVMGLI